MLMTTNIAFFIERFLEVSNKVGLSPNSLSLMVFNKGNKFSKLLDGSVQMLPSTEQKALKKLSKIEQQRTSSKTEQSS